MYDPLQTLQSLDANKLYVILFCGLAMTFNYIWFALAALKGFKDKVYPVPMFSTLFWLCGDGTGVTRYHMYFDVYKNWYLELFWCALIFTVSFEILFIYMTMKFGRKDLLPDWKQRDFNLLIGAAAVIFLVTWHYILSAMPDDLNIVYFNIANMAGPIGAAALMVRRRSTIGTTTGVWISYTIMLCFWYFAQAVYFGPAFRTPFMLAFFSLNIFSSAALAIYVKSRSRIEANSMLRGVSMA